ncbi:coiled-coil alpha-helical rod protein 1-like [Babylonia areolata]|uniref:coiled-coil alpha-helical rod protein 1-like n=1 Tax=Babylonia areolata TaxID=304850 RepID=UPI003FD6AC7C
MAAFLNKPSDFTAKSAKKQEPLTLLPPSAFEKPKTTPCAQPDVRLKKADDEIRALKLENQQLKNRLDGSLADSASFQMPPAGVQRTPVPMDVRHFGDELISRQGQELSQLRSQVQRLEHDQRAVRDDYERRLEAAERERQESVSALSDSLLRQEGEHQEEVSELRQQHEGEVLDLRSRLEHLSAELERSKGDLTMQVTDLTSELHSVRQRAKETAETLKQELKEKDGELTKQTQQIQQLRTYVAESEQKHQPQQVWMQQCETLANKLKIAEAEKERLESSIQLLDVRLKSMKEILLTQETELSKGKEELMDKNKVKELLLTRWRQKVYSLIVQQKSSDIVSKKDAQNMKEKMELVEERLSSAHNTINILQHTVAEKEAELQLAENRHTDLQHQMGQARQRVLFLEDGANKDGAAVSLLANSAQGFEAQFQHQTTVMLQALGQLKTFGQRISFASSRMDVLKSQLRRKEALKQLDDHQERETDTAAADTETEESWRVEREHMQRELSQVSGERDLLAAQLQNDSQAWTEKISSLRSHYDSEVGSLKRTVEDLESSIQQKTRVVEKQALENQDLREELEQVKELRDQLGTELARHQHTMDTALEEQRKRLEEEFTEQLADMESKVNDARREHTKAVVTLRQQERQWGRERERGEEVHAATEAHYQAQIERLHHDLLAVERERNLFMATLRQEGLLGNVRSERKEPMTLALQEEEEEEAGEVLQESYSATQVTETDSLNAIQDLL